MKLTLILLAILPLSYCVTDKIIISWKNSTTTGFGGYQADVLGIYYNTIYVWISTNSIPSYTIGGTSGTWSYNSNTVVPQSATYRFPRTAANASSKTKTSLGVVGLWIDGVAIYNMNDGNYYNSYWYQDAYYNEGKSFDSCYGHPDGKNFYHNHVNPICLSGYSYTDSSSHSPLLGFIFDGYPIYGPFGYSTATDASSSIKRMKSGYSLRNISQRTSLSNGTVLDSTYYGPDVSTSYPLGKYIEDYEWLSSNNGDLDEYGGRWCVTPEFPSGTYAYFVSTNTDGSAAFPYTVGKYYFGKITTIKNTTVTSGATTFFSYSS